jgi:hypothetical protein
VLLSTPLHASSNFTVSVQLANKRGFKQKKIENCQNISVTTFMGDKVQLMSGIITDIGLPYVTLRKFTSVYLC